MKRLHRIIFIWTHGKEMFYIKSCVRRSIQKIQKHKSFPAIHKVVNVGFFVHLLVEINWEQFPSKFVFVMMLDLN